VQKNAFLDELHINMIKTCTYACKLLCAITFGTFQSKNLWKKSEEDLPNSNGILLHKDEFLKAHMPSDNYGS